MSETTTLSIGSSGPIEHARSSIGSMTMKNASHNSDDRGSIGGSGQSSSQRPPRASPSRIDTISGSSTKLSAMGRMEKRGGSSSSIASSNTTNDSFAMRQSHYKEGIRLAEMGDWDVLVRRLPREPQLALQKDHHGMLPIHWACTEDDAGPAVIQALLVAFPEGVLTRNNAQYLPIHIAVRAALPIDSLKLLCDARPSSLLEETPNGKTPLLLAIEATLPAETINMLRYAQHAYEDPSEDNDNDRTIEDAKRDIEVQSHLLRESIMYAANPMGMLRSHSNNNVNGSSSLSIGRLQSNSVLGRFPSDARSSVSWADRRGQDASSNQSLTEDNNTPQPPQRTLHQLPPSTTTMSTTSSNTTGTAPSAVVRYMDTLVRNAHSLPNDDSELVARYTTNDEHLPQSTIANTITNSRMATRANTLRATEGDLATFDSGVCGVCYKKFSVFRKKYQCKSCWMVLCKKHVASKIELPGHKKKRSVCADCLVLHSDDGHSMLPAVPGHHHNGGRSSSVPSTFPHTHTGATYSMNSSSAIVPATRLNRADSTPGTQKTLGTMRNSALSSASSELRHTMASAPPRGSVRFAPPTTSSNNGVDAVDNESMLQLQKPPPLQLPPSESSAVLRSALDRFGSDMTASLTETDRNSAEVTLLHQRIGTLEEQNKILLSRLADQEKQYDDCMLLLTQTMTRVAEIEMRVPGLRFATNGSERESDSDINPASFEFTYPLTTSYNFGGGK